MLHVLFNIQKTYENLEMSSLPETPNLSVKAFTFGLSHRLAYASAFFPHVISVDNLNELIFFRELVSILCTSRFPLFGYGTVGKVFWVTCS